MIEPDGHHPDVCKGAPTQIKLLEDGLAPYSSSVEYEVVPGATQDFIKEIAKLSQKDLLA